jgi:Reverse transcriptase (RNA-dependent DNA polymerase)
MKCELLVLPLKNVLTVLCFQGTNTLPVISFLTSSCKARFVAGGHLTEAPASLTYSSVVSCGSVQICLLLAALNDLNILSCDIQGAYLTAPCREKVVTTAGLEFGPDLQGKLLIVVTRALYGLKSAGAAFRAYLANHLKSMDYRSSYANPDVWMQPAIKPDGTAYYEYILTYVDDILCISMDPMKSMVHIQQKFKLKGNKIEPPSLYLGATLSQLTTSNGMTCWAQSSGKYVNAAVSNVETYLANLAKPCQAAVSAPSCQKWVQLSCCTYLMLFLDHKVDGSKFTVPYAANY